MSAIYEGPYDDDGLKSGFGKMTGADGTVYEVPCTHLSHRLGGVTCGATAQTHMSPSNAVAPRTHARTCRRGKVA